MGIGISLLAAGMCLDALSGMPFGWHGFLWAMTYFAAPLIKSQFADDEPFAGRWLCIGGWLAFFMVAEFLLSHMFGFALPGPTEMILRWIVMFLSIPCISWIAWRLKKAYYRKLWMFLPEEMRISFR